MFVTVFLAAFTLASAAFAQGLAQPGKSWVQIASNRDFNAAIGVAREFPGDPSARVVLASNGWYAVVVGPVSEGTIGAYRQTHAYHDLPADAFIARGDGYVRSVWEPRSPILTEVELPATKPATAKAGDFTVTATASRIGSPNASIRVAGASAAGGLFTVDFPAPDLDDQYGNTAFAIVRLDKATRYPQVVVTGYTGGAHCCTETWIVTDASPGKWTVVQAETLDGGYQLEDLDGDGAAELVSLDNSFLYAFDAFAVSFAPLKIIRLSGGALADVTRTPTMRDRHVQSVSGFEFQARGDAALWRTNGFLAGWVGANTLVGRLPEAWTMMLPLYQRQSGFGKQVCASGAGLDKCPPSQVRTLPFPDGLARHLVENGYGPLPAGLAGLTGPVPTIR